MGSATFAGGVRILSVVGNRPQFVKSAPLSLALRERGVDEVVLHTGQHYDPELSAVFFEELELAPPRYRLETGSGTHGEQTGRMLPEIETAVLEENPDAVLVFGDTNSTLAGALAAGKVLVPVAHVEAGLRSFDRSMPEELNRMLVDRLSSMLFCPTGVAVANLTAEGITEGVHLVGDVMYDANLRLAPIARERSDALARNGVEPGRYLVLTLHREANVAPEPLERIAEALAELRRAGGLSRAPAHELGPGGGGDLARSERPPDPARRLSRLRRARLAGPRRPHGFRRRSEGGVLVRRPLRDAADDHGVGRDAGDWLEPARGERPRGDRGRRARGGSACRAAAALRRRSFRREDR